MSDAAVDDQVEQEEGEEAEEQGQKPRRRLSGKKLVMMVGVLLIAVVGAQQMGMLDSLLGGGKKAEEKAAPPQNFFYYGLPDLLVNLTPEGGRPSYLKLSISLELEDKDVVPELEKRLPRIIDNFQVYLRELRTEDLNGSAGIYRLREELLGRVNAAVKPIKVKDVLFKEMLIQ